LKEFGGRLRQLHLSEVNTQSRHDRLSFAAAISFSEIAQYVPEDIPIILESVVTAGAIEEEIRFARGVLPPPSSLANGAGGRSRAAQRLAG
jgi:hypothetical protein